MITGPLGKIFIPYHCLFNKNYATYLNIDFGKRNFYRFLPEEHFNISFCTLWILLYLCLKALWLSQKQEYYYLYFHSSKHLCFIIFNPYFTLIHINFQCKIKIQIKNYFPRSQLSHNCLMNIISAHIKFIIYSRPYRKVYIYWNKNYCYL